jgi:hypothetical protein
VEEGVKEGKRRKVPSSRSCHTASYTGSGRRGGKEGRKGCMKRRKEEYEGRITRKDIRKEGNGTEERTRRREDGRDGREVKEGTERMEREKRKKRK